MIPKRNRYTTRLFDRVFRRGTRGRSPSFQAIYTPWLQPARIAVVVKKKLAKQATDRNRLRRQIYAQVQKTDILHHQKGGMILLYTGDTKLHNPAELASEMQQLWSKFTSTK